MPLHEALRVWRGAVSGCGPVASARRVVTVRRGWRRVILGLRRWLWGAWVVGVGAAPGCLLGVKVSFLPLGR
ncbi:hypothetical protein GCM10027091_72790 [Streptomyces daliensis]